MYKYFIALSSLMLTFNASAVTFQGNAATTKAEVVVKQDSRVGLAAVGVNENIPEDNVSSAIGLFLLNLGIQDTGVNVSLAGGNETIIKADGTVYSNTKKDGTKLIAQLTASATRSINTDASYLPDTANKAADAAALLYTSDKNGYTEQLNFRGADVPQNITPGQYVFSFVAQAYTE